MLYIIQENPFRIEKFIEGDELWLSPHKDDPIQAPIVIRFNDTFQNITGDNTVILRVTKNRLIEIIYLNMDGGFNFSCIHPNDVVGDILNFKNVQT